MRIFYIVLKILISVIENILLVSKNHILFFFSYSHKKKEFTGNRTEQACVIIQKGSTRRYIDTAATSANHNAKQEANVSDSGYSS